MEKNKKILVIIIIMVFCLCGFIGYFLNNSKCDCDVLEENNSKVGISESIQKQIENAIVCHDYFVNGGHSSFLSNCMNFENYADFSSENIINEYYVKTKLL